MEHEYTQDQVDTIRALHNQAFTEYGNQCVGTKVYVSDSYPGSVFVRCIYIEIANDGGGGFPSEWSKVDLDGTVLRDAYKNIEFEDWYDRIVFFQGLTEVSSPM